MKATDYVVVKLGPRRWIVCNVLASYGDADQPSTPQVDVYSQYTITFTGLLDAIRWVREARKGATP